MRLAVSITALIAVVLVAGASFANTPDPTFSTFGTYLNRSPQNEEVNNATFQSTFEGNLRTAGNQPAVGVSRDIIELRILSPCANPVVLNPDADSDANGDIQWGVAKLDQGGGACIGTTPAPVVEIHVLGVGLFATLNSVSSPDVNGVNCADLQDFVAIRNAFNTGSPLYIGDLDGDGDIDLQDFTYFVRHFNATPCTP